MKFLTPSLLAISALSSLAFAKKDEKQMPTGTCEEKQEYDMGCSDTVSPHLGINTIVVCRSGHWQVMQACPGRYICTDEPHPHCWSGNPIDVDDDNEEGFVRGTKETEEFFWGQGKPAPKADE